jgi:hypothetical protein
VNAIAGLPTGEAVREHLKDLAAEIRDEVEEMRDALKQASTRQRWSVLGVSAPASVAAGTALAGQSIAIAGPLGGVASAALAISSFFFQRSNTQHDPAGHYLLCAERAVKKVRARNPSTAIRRLFSP